MSVGNIFILSVLISFSTFNLIHAENIRGEVIPQLNVTEILGNWYLVASTVPSDKNVCMTNNIDKKYNNEFTMNVTAVLKPGAEWVLAHDTNVVYNAILTATMKNDSSVFPAKGGDPVDKSKTQFIVIFQEDPNSYIAMYTAETESGITSGSDGKMFVFSRKVTLSDDILMNIKNSALYKQGVDAQEPLLTYDLTACPK